MAADLARIKRNVAKMAAQSAPEAEIDAYIASEGTTIDDVRNYRSGVTQLQGSPGQMAAPVEPSANVEWAPGQAPAPTPQPTARSGNLGMDLLGAAASTANGMMNFPVIGPLLTNTSDAIIGTGAQLTGGDYGQTVDRLRQNRQTVNQEYPVSNLAGSIAAPVGGFTVASKAPAVAQALGATGPFWQQMANSIMSTKGLEVADNLVRGKTGMDAVGGLDTVAMGAAGPVVGQVIGKTGDAIADAVTGARQNALTKTAIAGAPSAASLRKTGSDLFDAATGGTSPMVAPNALDRLMSSVRNATAKYRPNQNTSPKAYGLLQTVTDMIQAGKTPGTVVDFKDLHILRQTAQKVAQSSDGVDSAVGSLVIKQIDDFISTLKSADTLGNVDPTQAAGDLMKGISTWSKASKTAAIQDAIDAAETYKSGVENGLKLSFLKLMKSPDFKRFSAAEKEAIRRVAKGTTKQNIAELFGKLGFSFGGSAAHNVVGGSLGTSGLAAVLSPALGPLAIPAALGATTAAGMAGRNIAERIGTANANRAAQVFAAGNIPTAAQVANPLLGAKIPIELLVRGGALSSAGGS